MDRCAFFARAAPSFTAGARHRPTESVGRSGLEDRRVSFHNLNSHHVYVNVNVDMMIMCVSKSGVRDRPAARGGGCGAVSFVRGTAWSGPDQVAAISACVARAVDVGGGCPSGAAM